MTTTTVIEPGPSAVPARARPRVIYMRCTENRVEDDYDGGLVLFLPVAGQPTDELVDGRLVLSFKHDEPMHEYPVTRDEKQRRVYRVTLEEVSLADVPPDPRAPKSPSAFELLTQARDAAARDGNQALAAQLTQQLGDGVAP